MKLSISLILLSILSGCTIVGKMPKSSTQQVTETELPISNIGVPITVNIAPIEDQLNTTVPKQVRNPSFPKEDDDGNSNCFKYEINRQPISVDGSGNKFHINTELHYFMEGHVQFVFACAAWITCGNDDVSPYPRILGVSYETALEFQPDYSLASKTSDPKVDPKNECPATFLKIDVAGKIAEAAKSPLTVVKGKLDDYIKNNSSFKQYAQTAWDELNKDIKLGSDLFLRVKPSGFYSSGLNSKGKNVEVTFGISAAPEIVTTSNTQRTIPALPSLNIGGGPNNFNIYFDIKSDYNLLSKELNNMYANHRYPLPGDQNVYVDLKSIEAYGIGGSKVTFKFIGSGKIKFKKYKKTVFYVNAQPIYNASDRTISFTNVTVDTESNDIFVKAGLNLFNLPIIQGIQERRIPVGDVIDNGITSLNNLFNTKINDKVSISGTVNNLIGLGLNPKVSELIFRANLSGNLNLTVTP